MNPMEVKKRLAREIVGEMHGPEAAPKAEESFARTFQEGEVPEDVVEYHIVSQDDQSNAVD